jgi:hypothetical protein
MAIEKTAREIAVWQRLAHENAGAAKIVFVCRRRLNNLTFNLRRQGVGAN